MTEICNGDDFSGWYFKRKVYDIYEIIWNSVVPEVYGWEEKREHMSHSQH